MCNYNNDTRFSSIYGQTPTEQNRIIANLRQTLPATFSRQEASRLLGHLISVKTFSNLDAKRQGPPKFQVGGKVAYEKERFLTWLKQRMRE